MEACSPTAMHAAISKLPSGLENLESVHQKTGPASQRNHSQSGATHGTLTIMITTTTTTTTSTRLGNEARCLGPKFCPSCEILPILRGSPMGQDFANLEILHPCTTWTTCTTALEPFAPLASFTKRNGASVSSGASGPSKQCKITRFQDCGLRPSSIIPEQDWQDCAVKSCPPFRAKQTCPQSCQKSPKILQTKIGN